jgi:putative holliday junction resolvase
MAEGNRFLGIDFGSKRVGTALSDEAGTLAFPLAVLENSESLTDEVARLCTEHGIGAVVVGESKDFSQHDNPIMDQIRAFVAELQSMLSVPVILHPEFMTSAQAEHIQGKTAMHDASAAALILQSYLDTHNDSHSHEHIN